MNYAKTPLKPFGIRLDVAPGTGIRELRRAHVLQLLFEHKLVVVRGLDPLGHEQLLAFAADDPARELLPWNFGPSQTTAPSRAEVGPHWDGAFYLEPRVLVYHCVAAPRGSSGGQTTFVDSESLWTDAPPSRRALWKKLELTLETNTNAPHSGRVTVPMVQHHPDKPVTIVRYAETTEGGPIPIHLEVAGLKNVPLESFREEMHELLASKKYLYEHDWRENDLVLADNFSLLHGRRAISEAGPRHLLRVQIR